ncbi:MAG: methyltransferase domain-containing protein [Sedimentisphaerales bacterium]|nr:methyltransferase domain-containing protein [Sedimentisphaerales bacterium]
MSSRKLNVGCGKDIKEGWINLDLVALPGVDVVCDIERTPLPFANEQFDEILCKDVLEHVEYIPVLSELHRILKVGGRLKIRVPHFTSRASFADPTHKKIFTFRTFQFFVKNSEKGYYFNYHFEKISCIKIAFRKGVLCYNYLVEPVVNLCIKMMAFYEATAFSRIFPADNIYVEFVK